jgi:hypothetical protein
MKRALAVLLCATAVTSLGCLGAASYETRLEKSLTNLQYQEELKKYLNDATPGPLKDLGVYLRPPKGFQKAPSTLLPVQPGAFDAAESFSGGDSKNGPPIQVHILARLKKKPKPQAKPGQPAPPQQADRAPGSFIPDVQTVLQGFYGGSDAIVGAKLDKYPVQRGRQYQRLKFASATGNTIDVYFFDQGNHLAALVWDIPAPQAASEAITKGKDRTLGSFAVGRTAANLFEGRDEDEAPRSGGGGGGSAGVTF